MKYSKDRGFDHSFKTISTSMSSKDLRLCVSLLEKLCLVVTLLSNKSLSSQMFEMAKLLDHKNLVELVRSIKNLFQKVYLSNPHIDRTDH